MIIHFILIVRPRTEPFMIKQHLTIAVGLTQIVLLVSLAAYRKKVRLLEESPDLLPHVNKMKFDFVFTSDSTKDF